MNDLQERQLNSEAQAPSQGVRVPAEAYLLEMSLDWIVLRASENIHRLLGHSHVALIQEPLGEFVKSQALHDLRNLFSRLSGTTGIARAYRVRLTDEPDLHDIAFQVSDGRVILEAVPTPSDGLGDAFGGVGGLVAGLAHSSGQALLDGGVRRMRALSGYDRVTLMCRDKRAESCRGPFAAPADMAAELPAIIADSSAQSVGIFPREQGETSVGAALTTFPDASVLQQLREQGVRASLCIRFALEDGSNAEFRCDCRTPRQASFELHAAAELFAQLFAMRLEIDRLKNG